jgi:hypothetical protein
VSFNFLPSQYQAGLALEDKQGSMPHSSLLQDTVWS